jgi:hypothetical protein
MNKYKNLKTVCCNMSEERAKQKVTLCYFLKKLLCQVPIFFIQKPMTPLKQIARHRMAFFEIKSDCPSDFPKNIT